MGRNFPKNLGQTIHPASTKTGKNIYVVFGFAEGHVEANGFLWHQEGCYPSCCCYEQIIRICQTCFMFDLYL